ncbi:hypothetical protein JCM5350_000078 [Sporobolomyces pararoseus]
MFSSLTSLPSTLASSTVSFLSNRKKTFAYLGATVGGAYAVGQWGVQKMMEASERGRKQTGAKNDLLNRFNLNLQDAQFTVQALLPTVASQLQSNLDVEDRTSQLGEIAKAERSAKLKELERLRKEKEEQDELERSSLQQEEEQRIAQEQKPNGTGKSEEGIQQNGTEDSEKSQDSAAQPTTNGIASEERVEQEEQTSTILKPTLNPAAPAFQPRFTVPPLPSPPKEDFPKLNGHTSDPDPTQSSSPKLNGASSDSGDSETTKAETGEANGLGKSWAEVVKTEKESESVENGGTGVVENRDVEIQNTAETEKAHDAPTIAEQEPITVEEKATEEPVPENVEPETPTAPTKTKVQLWNEIKILSFTRLLTSIYVLSLLTLQTHVQLALLGRAHYVKSLIDTLPPRSPSPKISLNLNEKGKGKEEEPMMSNDEDLEAALYKAKELSSSREEDRVSEDVERKYLTFSWWLLHEGWKVVRDRVQEKVEEVVGPMGLKTPVVYGELSALMGEIRRRIETQPDGSRFDFSAALHPPTPSDEVHTLVTGGGFASPSPSESSTSDSLISQPLRSLLNETSDFLLSPDGSLILTLTLDRLFSLSISKLEPAFSTPISGPIGDEARGARFEDVTEKQTKLASLLPVLTRLSAAGLEGQAGVLRGGHGNEFVEAIDDIRELREFVAIVYASYDRDNLRASY